MMDLPTASALAFLPLPLQTHVLTALRERAAAARGLADVPPPAQGALFAVPAAAATATPDGSCASAARGSAAVQSPAAGASAVEPPDSAAPATRSTAADAAQNEILALLAEALRDAARAGVMWEAARRAAEQAIARGVAAGLRPIASGEPAYPMLLTRIADPPPLLWLRGEAAALAAPCVAIVGSRAASPYGLQVAERLGADLAGAGVTVISGLARGVDSAAHRGALTTTTGRTIAILGSGADVIYPPEHATLAADIVARGGALLSELPPGAPPRRGHFPRRNRLISGTSLAVVVIEASIRSGSLQTARFGLEQGREVMAVPGSILGERHRGCHALLRDGAKLVEFAADVLEELRLPDAQAAGAERDEQPDRLLLAMTPGEAYDVRELTLTTGLPAARVLRQVLLLEVGGRLLRTAGPRYIRPCRIRAEQVGRSCCP
jgi:DNA processing protein